MSMFVYTYAVCNNFAQWLFYYIMQTIQENWVHLSTTNK